jgi:hypothetical protein
MLEGLTQDARFASRLFRRQWLAASLALGCLALGIGEVWLGAARWLAHSLYGVRADQPAMFAMAALVLSAVAFAAAYGPAHRASVADPMAALRTD